MAVHYCLGCMRNVPDTAECIFCHFKSREYRTSPTVLSPNVLLKNYRVGALVGQSRQAQFYAALDTETDTPVLLEEFFPFTVAGRRPGEPRVVTQHENYETACRMFLESRDERGLPLVCAFEMNNTVYRVYMLSPLMPPAAQAAALVDAPLYFRDETKKPLMTINALTIPAMPRKRGYRAPLKKWWPVLLVLALLLALGLILGLGCGKPAGDAALPAATSIATEAPTEEPTAEPTEAPTEEPTAEPTEAPTEEPTAEPTEALTEEPTAEPTEAPTEEPTSKPTKAPTEEPTSKPTEAPTEEPTAEPTEAPTEELTAEPMEEPTEEPTAEPTEAPTEEPTAEPTEAPTEEPTAKPTKAPTKKPAVKPTEVPAVKPTAKPTDAPTKEPAEASGK